MLSADLRAITSESPFRERISAAIGEWRKSCVVMDGEAIEPYTRSAIGVQRPIPAVIKANCVEQVGSIVKIANRYAVPLYPISTGRNWGYGSSIPASHDCVILDLSEMTRIQCVAPELGVFAVEPGTTQGMLHEYLQQNGHEYFVPVHGGGPDCSLIGNALERGYGITPNADHFAALTSVEAVLPSGDVYRSPMSSLGCDTVDGCFKWGIGPYLDGLFTQSGMGIVTKATFALAPRTGIPEGFVFSLNSDDELGSAVDAIRQILRLLPGSVASVNLMNSLRVLSMTADYPAHEVSPGAAIPADVIEKLAARRGIGRWTAIGAIYGDRRMRKCGRHAIRSILRSKHIHKRLFFSQRHVWWGRKCSPILPQHAHSRIEAMSSFLDLANGVPQRVALSLAYWKTRRRVDGPPNPSRDRCGLMWFSPLIPMRDVDVKRYVACVEAVCPRFGIDPLITLTSLNDRVFDSTVPILFRQQEPCELESAESCWRALYEQCRMLGYLPYRLGINTMDCLTDASSVSNDLVEKIKHAIDPNRIIAPGRYCRD